MKEPTNKNNNLNALFDTANDDFYYTLQGMNFSGYEIKRLLRMPKADIDIAWNAYYKVLDTVKKTTRSTLTPDEQRFYDYADYYVTLVQKDVRNRVKLSIINYILVNSIEGHRNKLKIVKNPDFERIIPYQFIEQIFDMYKLKDVYNLVFYEKDSKYITNIIKPLAVNASDAATIVASGQFDILEADLRKQNVNIGDEVIFVDNILTIIHISNVYEIEDINKNGTMLTVSVGKKEQINDSKKQDILDEFKEN